MKNFLAFIFGFVGILLIMGSANDCDGACMENANTLEEMLLISLGGLACLFVAFLIAEMENLK